MSKPRVRIVARPDGYYVIEKRTWLGWQYVICAYNMADAEAKAQVVLNPVIKEYV